VLLSLLMGVAVIAAVVAMGRRRWHRAWLRREAGRRAGATPELAIPVRSYAEMDAPLAGRWCACGGYLERFGEGSREQSGRRYRVARLRCQECERVDEVFFDTTDLLH
jgi:hypothetical protein